MTKLWAILTKELRNKMQNVGCISGDHVPLNFLEISNSSSNIALVDRQDLLHHWGGIRGHVRPEDLGNPVLGLLEMPGACKPAKF